ncbi:unnamed protein product [Eruca vesicaria subsp. sativa]|uniref:Uncharacterized protein n=1 Tax=Eruca vesicaria subsp. sativa TaxID=29727 RepID=A0ABC8IZW3_ERUVS|nr:unnamed protein product [Eruca vesicaria subsp. sativa]
MLDIAYELVGQATSNSLLMFCFCNLIIVIIITGSSKPGSTDSQDYTFTTSVSFTMCSNVASEDHDCGDEDDEEMIDVDVSSAQDEPLTDASSISKEYKDKESIQCCDDDEEEEDEDEDEDDDDESNEADVEEEEEDDELRKRAEEFIAKVNNEWKYEKLRALNLVY